MVGIVEPTFTKQKHYKASIWLLVFLNLVSLLAAAGLVLVLNPEDRISPRRGLALSSLGMVYFVSMFELCNVVVLYTTRGAAFMKKYSLGCGDVLDINNKLVSAVQAGWCVVTGAVVCLYSCQRDFLHASHYMSEAYAWFGAAYFFYDVWSMYMVHVQMYGDPSRARKAGAPVPGTSFVQYCCHEPVILMHHLFIGGFGFLVIVYLRGPLGDCTFGFVYLMELSTPCVSLRGVLSRLRLKESRLYLVNGLAMLATFCACRLLGLPYVCYLYSKEINLPYFQAINTLPTGCKISILILLLPQVYWFYLMSAGALKIFLKSDKSSADKSARLSAGDADKRS